MGNDGGVIIFLLIIAAYYVIPFLAKILWGGAKFGAKTTSKAVVGTAKLTSKAVVSTAKFGAGVVLEQIAESKEQKRWEKEQERDRLRWEEQLRRKLIEEEQISKVRNKSMIDLYSKQVELLIQYKREGLNIDKEIFDMREKLLVLERQENNAMVQDLLDTLDRL